MTASCSTGSPRRGTGRSSRVGTSYPESPGHLVQRSRTLPGDVESESRKLEAVEEVVQVLERDAESRVAGEDRNGLGQCGERVRRL